MRASNDDDGWNPYLAGALSGLVLVLSVWIAGEYFGASTSFVLSAGMIKKIFANCCVCAHAECQFSLGSYEPSGALNEAVSEPI